MAQYVTPQQHTSSQSSSTAAFAVAVAADAPTTCHDIVVTFETLLKPTGSQLIGLQETQMNRAWVAQVLCDRQWTTQVKDTLRLLSKSLSRAKLRVAV